MFLVLSANPGVLCTGVDLCKRLAPEWGPVDIYVEVAVGWLQEFFPGRVTFLKGDCLTEIPNFVASHAGATIDLAHIDGDKRTYLRDFGNLWPLLTSESKVVFDDTNLPMCRMTVQAIIDSGRAILDPEFPDTNTERYQNTVVKIVKLP